MISFVPDVPTLEKFELSYVLYIYYIHNEESWGFFLPSSIPTPAQLDWVSFIFDFPHPHPPGQVPKLETWNKAVQNYTDQTTSMEDDLNGRRP